MARVALVTGASRGLGLAIAKSLAGEGMTVVGLARTRGWSAQVPGAVEYACDLAQTGAIAEVAAKVKVEVGAPTVLVNNAGYGGPYGLLHDTGSDQWARVMAVNVTAAFELVRACVPGMGQGGRIVNIASVYGLTGGAGSGAYTAAKHALVGLTRAAAAEYGGRGITCNAVCPGYCETEMTAGLEKEPRRLARIPAGRFGRPEEVAALVKWLCSTESSYVNGAVISVDGGMGSEIAAGGEGVQ